MIMSLFSFRQITSTSSIGESLRKKRAEAGLELAAISDTLKISQKYLQALEDDNWEVFPGDIYLNNFLKRYCEYLGITDIKLVGLKKKNGNYPLSGAPSVGQAVVKKSLLINYPRLLKNIFFFIIISGFLIYLGLKVNILIAPPKIDLFFPAQDLILSSHTIEVKGRVEGEVRLLLNNEDLGVDQNGFFQKTLDLKSGLNIIKLQAKKRYGKETVVTRRLIVSEEQ